MGKEKKMPTAEPTTVECAAVVSVLNTIQPFDRLAKTRILLTALVFNGDSDLVDWNKVVPK